MIISKTKLPSNGETKDPVLKPVEPQSLIRLYHVNELYSIIDKVGRGTYGTVYKARGLKDGRYYAIKKLENNDAKLQQQGFPITALREISLLKQINHPNLIHLHEIILSKPNKRNMQRGSTFLVFQYMDHDLAGLSRMKRHFTLSQIKCIIKQLLEGVAYLHRHRILHRDIKSANILLSDNGEIKLADFGLGRRIRHQNMLTYKVVTLWYRAPELLLGCKNYTDKIDVWSIGCVLAQLLCNQVLFRKQTEYALMERIYQICGGLQENGFTEQQMNSFAHLNDMRSKKPYPKNLAGHLRRNNHEISSSTIEFVEALLQINPKVRLSCEQALSHKFFIEKPYPCEKSQIQKMDYECHEMFKDRSIKIERDLHKGKQNAHISGKDLHKLSLNPLALEESKQQKTRKQPSRTEIKSSVSPRDRTKHYHRQDKGRQDREFSEHRHGKGDTLRYKKKRHSSSDYSSTSSLSSRKRSRERRRRKDSYSRSVESRHRRRDRSDSYYKRDYYDDESRDRHEKTKKYREERKDRDRSKEREKEDQRLRLKNKDKEKEKEKEKDKEKEKEKQKQIEKQKERDKRQKERQKQRRDKQKQNDKQRTKQRPKDVKDPYKGNERDKERDKRYHSPSKQKQKDRQKQQKHDRDKSKHKDRQKEHRKGRSRQKSHSRYRQREGKGKYYDHDSGKDRHRGHSSIRSRDKSKQNKHRDRSRQKPRNKSRQHREKSSRDRSRHKSQDYRDDSRDYRDEHRYRHGSSHQRYHRKQSHHKNEKYKSHKRRSSASDSSDDRKGKGNKKHYANKQHDKYHDNKSHRREESY